MTRRRLNITVVVVVVVVVVTLVTLCCCRCCCCSCCFRFWLHSLLVFSRFFCRFMWPIHKMYIFYTFHTHPRIFALIHRRRARVAYVSSFLTSFMLALFYFFFLLFCTHTFSHLFELSWSGLVVFVVAVGSIYFFKLLHTNTHTNTHTHKVAYACSGM